MTLINAITQQPIQQLELVLPDSTITPFNMQYMDNPQGWFFSLPDFNINNMRAVVSPNILSQFYRTLDFGLALDTTDGYEAIFINDFSSGRASLYLLDADDVQGVLDIIQNVS